MSEGIKYVIDWFEEREGDHHDDCFCDECIARQQAYEAEELITKLSSRPANGLEEALVEIMSYTKLGIGSISRIRGIAGKALAKNRKE